MSYTKRIILPDGKYAKNRPEYTVWLRMKDRCYNKNSEFYHRYGSRGIVVCNAWLGEGGFLRFYKDLGDRPTSKHQLDRIDNDGNYEPSNCRWTTASINAINRNRRSDNTWGYRGVYRVTSGGGYYLAQIGFQRKRIHLGVFDNYEDAAIAYDCAAIQLFGNDAKLNILTHI